MRISLIFIFVLAFFCCGATTFYIDAATTSATQNGTLANPWKTLSQVASNQSLFQPGDFVLFKRGGTYPGTFYPTRGGTSTSPLTFGAYGTGAKPKFTGTGSNIGYLFYVQNKSYIVFRDLWVTDPTIDNGNRAVSAKILRAFTFDQDAPYNRIVSCDVTLVGTGVYLISGNNTIDSCDMGNMRMMVNTNNGGYDDYGANPVVISSPGNSIKHNNFHDCWAPSYDFDYDGGAIEMYGSNLNNNFIGYNTMSNNLGLVEIGSDNGGTCTNTVFAYNKLVNNGGLFFIHNQNISVSNLQYYNNVIIETSVGLAPDNYLCATNSTTSGSGIVVMKNNIFWLTTGIDVARSSQFSGSQLVHQDNIYRLGANSVLNFTQHSTELVTSANNIFTATTAPDPVAWNFSPVANGPAIDFGQSVGLAKDFAGNPVPSVPNAGLLESGGTQTPALAMTATFSSIACFGGTSTVTITATGGTAPYSGTGNFTATAGSHTYNVTDATGAMVSQTVNVTQPSQLAGSLSAGTITVAGGTTTITVLATGGTSPYTYKIASGAFQSSNTFSGVTVGDYVITIKDSKGCQITKNITLTLNPGNPLRVTATAGTILCNGGSANVTVAATGGVAPYSGTGVFVKAAGTFSFVVTDAAGGSATTSVTIAQPSAISFTTSFPAITIFGGVTSVTVIASGGTAPYQYCRNNGAYGTLNVLGNVAAGNHTITVKDAKGCTLVKPITITAPAQSGPLLVTATAGIIACRGGTTTVTVAASGGRAPYTGTGTFTRAAGTYSFSVTDANGVTAAASVTISQPTTLRLAITKGSSSISASGSGGTAPYTYKLDNGAYQTSGRFSGVSAGSHTVTVKDARGCTRVKTITVYSQRVQTPEFSRTGFSDTSDEELDVVTKDFDVLVFPNPSQNEFNVKISALSNSISNVSVSGADGRLLLQKTVSGNSLFSIGQNFTTGSYFLRIQTGKEVKTLRLIKTN